MDTQGQEINDGINCLSMINIATTSLCLYVSGEVLNFSTHSQILDTYVTKRCQKQAKILDVYLKVHQLQVSEIFKQTTLGQSLNR